MASEFRQCQTDSFFFFFSLSEPEHNFLTFFFKIWYCSSRLLAPHISKRMEGSIESQYTSDNFFLENYKWIRRDRNVLPTNCSMISGFSPTPRLLPDRRLIFPWHFEVRCGLWMSLPSELWMWSHVWLQDRSIYALVLQGPPLSSFALLHMEARVDLKVQCWAIS